MVPQKMDFLRKSGSLAYRRKNRGYFCSCWQCDGFKLRRFSKREFVTLTERVQPEDPFPSSELAHTGKCWLNQLEAGFAEANELHACVICNEETQ